MKLLSYFFIFYLFFRIFQLLTSFYYKIYSKKEEKNSSNVKYKDAEFEEIE